MTRTVGRDAQGVAALAEPPHPEAATGPGTKLRDHGPDSAKRTPLSYYLASQPKRGSTTDAVTEALREAILDGTVEPFTWLREGEIARELSVSRTPVREALRRLADEGLTYWSANRGSVVAPMTLDDILAVYAVRESLEALAARTVALRQPSGTVEMLRATHNKMVEATAQGRVDELARLNLELHRILRSQSGNPYLDRFLTQVERAVRRFGRSTYENDERRREALVEHKQIIEAIAAGDPDGAHEAALAHMRNARQSRVSTMLGS